MSTANQTQPPNPPPQVVVAPVKPTAMTSTNTGFSIAAGAGVIILLLQSFGVINQKQADDLNTATKSQIVQQLQQAIDKAAADKAATKATDTTNQTAPKPVEPLKTVPVVDPSKTSITPQGQPTATIVATDSKGKPLQADVGGPAKLSVTAEPNALFTVMSTGSTHSGKDTSLKWEFRKSADAIQMVPIPEGGGNGTTAGYAVVMPPDTSLTMFLSVTQGDVLATTSLIVKCGQGAMPPPIVVIPSIVPQPQPQPAVTPTPIVNQTPTVAPPPVVNPVSNDMRVIIVYNPSQNHSQAQLNVLNSLKIFQALDTKCVKTGTQPSWRRWSVNLSEDDVKKDGDADLKKLWTSIQADIKASSPELPAIYIACGGKVVPKTIGTTMKVDEAIAVLNCGG